MRLFKKKPDVGPKVIEVPPESAGALKRLCSPGYLLLHPGQTWKGMLLEFLGSVLYLSAGLIILLYLWLEGVTFLYLVTTYGFLR